MSSCFNRSGLMNTPPYIQNTALQGGGQKKYRYFAAAHRKKTRTNVVAVPAQSNNSRQSSTDRMPCMGGEQPAPTSVGHQPTSADMVSMLIGPTDITCVRATKGETGDKDQAIL